MVHEVDHFKCYKAKLSKGSAKLPKGTQLTLRDQFTDPAKIFDVGTLSHLCVPVDKRGEGVKNPAGVLGCHKVKSAKAQPKHIARLGVGLNNQFGPLTRDTSGEAIACMPGVLGFTPTPTPSA